MNILFFLIFFSFIIPQIAYGSEISAIPEKAIFGPNDWIKIFLNIDGYSGGEVNWNATQPDGSTVSGSIASLQASKTTHTIIRNAFDNQFGHWNIEYQYNNVTKLVDVEVESLIISATTDKLSYGPNDIATVQFSTNYYDPNSAKAESLSIKILDDKGTPAKLVEDVEIKVSQPNVALRFSIHDLLKYNAPGNYHAVVNYYNVATDVPFVVYDTSSKTIFLGSDKNLYDLGDSVEIDIVIPDLSASSGVLTITSPSGKVNTKTISTVSSLNRVHFDGITSSEIGTYAVRFVYGDNIATKTFDVLIESLAKPTLSEFDIDIFLDKSQYRPGETVNATIITSKLMEQNIVYWFEDPSGNNSEQISLVDYASNAFTIPHILEINSLQGPWKIHVKYGTVESFAVFGISGEPAFSEKTPIDVIPDWIRNNAHWWIEEQITDDDFATGLEFMIKEKIIVIPNLVPSDSSEAQIPDWVKNTTRWWADGLISDQEFANGIKFLVISHIIQV
ncbi:MAG: hypothetical protein K8Q88_02205 [Nitrosarchaeum sp.]|nr:hypothetical protein [Nitrosarchaeum sp.]